MLLALGVWLAGPTAARASVIEYRFGGVITAADPSTGAAPGTPFSGTFSYDPSTFGGSIEFEGHSQVVYGGPGWGFSGPPSPSDTFTLQIGGQTVVQESGALATTQDFLQYTGQYGYKDSNGNPKPAYTTLTVGNGAPGPLSATLTLNNPSSYVPLAFNQNGGPFLALFPNATLTVSTINPDQKDPTLFQGTLTTLNAVPTTVPEPGVAPLFLLAAAWLACTGRLRKGRSGQDAGL